MPEPLPDHYRLLGVLPSATQQTIHAAYRDRARVLHPDRSGDDTAMKQLNIAWDTLRDPPRRAAYDRERRIHSHGESVVLASAPHVSVAPDHAGPPPGRPFGPVMSYGRYEGWSLGEIAQYDPGWLRWLRRVPAGRHLARDIDAVFAELEERPLTLGGRRPLGTFARRAFAHANAES
jgi:curved DNA-binding protein CbpA